jgi:hypothetical protein
MMWRSRRREWHSLKLTHSNNNQMQHRLNACFDLTLPQVSAPGHEAPP